MTELGHSVASLLEGDRVSRVLARQVWPTGFALLDSALGGGLHERELVLVGGTQGLGKTTFALQVARQLALSGRQVTYLCYEHAEEDILARLVAMESGLAAPDDPPLPRTAFHDRHRHRATAAQVTAALEAVRAYGDQLTVVRGVRPGAAGGTVRLEELGSGDGRLLVVDYLQKVPSRVPHAPEDERVTDVVERLKDLALHGGGPVLALVAADKSGLTGRTTLPDLRGSTALAYEADVALLLNDKQRIVARHHLMYGSPDASRFQEWVVCTVEKNRTGPAPVDVQLRKRFAYGCFDPCDTPVTEQLLDDRVHRD